MKEFLVEILTPEKAFFSGRVESLRCNTPDGEIGILSGHETMIAVLSPGVISFKVNGEWKTAVHSEGFLEVRPDETLIFIESCEWPENIDLERAEKARARAEERLLHPKKGDSIRHSQIALARAMVRLQQKGKSSKIG